MPPSAVLVTSMYAEDDTRSLSLDHLESMQLGSGNAVQGCVSKVESRRDKRLALSSRDNHIRATSRSWA